MAFSINYSFVDFNSLGYGKRIGLFLKDQKSLIPINSRNEIGKLGIATNNSIIGRIFHRTIAISAINDNTEKRETIYLNRSSTIKWLNAQLNATRQLTPKERNRSILERLVNINKLVKTKHSPENVNKQKVNSIRIKIRRIFCRAILSLTSSSWALFMIRMKLFTSSEKKLQKRSEALACHTFQHAIGHVSAYTDFCGSSEISSFNDIPIIDKKSYILKYAQDKQFGELSLYVDGVIPAGSKKDTSTGTSGRATSWYRGPKEVKMINQSINLAAKVVFKNKPYYMINGFALGPWATGISIANAVASDPNATVCNIGLDTKEIFQAIKDAVKVLPAGYPIVIAGYPPHLKEVVDFAEEEGFPLDQYNIIGIVGGEAMSESQRSFIVSSNEGEGAACRTGFKQCYSAYGASDLDVAIGYEDDFAIELRKKLHSNPDLARELLGDSDFIPMIFPYDPINYHIETDAEQNLIYTCTRGDRISPRVRYNLGDRGKTMQHSDVLSILKKHGIKMEHHSVVNLPFLFVWGRVGSHVSIEGLKIAPENLDDALNEKGLFPRVTNYGFLQFEEDGVPGIKIIIEVDDLEGIDAEAIKSDVIQGLRNHNQEFNKLMTEGRPMPQLIIYPKGASPMSAQRKMNPTKKKQYIFNAGDEFDRASIAENCIRV